jgi:hypothetical protein
MGARPEQGLILLVDRDPIAVRVGHREGSAERAVVGFLEDRESVRHDLFVERGRIAGPPPELDRRRVG